MCWSGWSFNIPSTISWQPTGTWLLTTLHAWGAGNLNLACMGWEIWTWTVWSFQWNKCLSYYYLSLNTTVFKGKEFTFTSKWLRWKGIKESHSHWSCLNKEIDLEIQHLVIHLSTILDHGGRNFNKPILKSLRTSGVHRSKDVEASNWLMHHLETKESTCVWVIQKRACIAEHASCRNI